MRDFKKLGVWEGSHRLTLAAYKATATFPREEIYGLTNRIRRSCAAIPANMAEGCGRGTNNDLARFLRMASGSASELEYHLLLARGLSWFDEADHDRLAGEVAEIKRMLTSFAKNLRAFSSLPALKPETSFSKADC